MCCCWSDHDIVSHIEVKRISNSSTIETLREKIQYIIRCCCLKCAFHDRRRNCAYEGEILELSIDDILEAVGKELSEFGSYSSCANSCQQFASNVLLNLMGGRTCCKAYFKPAFFFLPDPCQRCNFFVKWVVSVTFMIYSYFFLICGCGYAWYVFLCYFLSILLPFIEYHLEFVNSLRCCETWCSRSCFFSFNITRK